MAARKVVPFRRTLRQGSVGPDVLGMKRALVRADCLPPKPGGQPLTNQFGKATQAGVRKFQKRAQIVSDGIYGLNTHRKLMPYVDSRGAWLFGQDVVDLKRLPSIRQRIMTEAMWGYNSRAAIHYAQVRPMHGIGMGHALPQTLDCSEFVTCCYKRADAPDPNRLLFNGLGYTGTLATHGVPVSLNQARPADLVLYGHSWPYEHVSMYVGFGRCVSHGSEGGPYLVPVDYRSDRAMIRSYLP